MKKTFIPLAIILLTFIYTSCDSLLEVDADNVINENVFSTTEQIETALNGAYFNFTGTASALDGGELLGGDFSIIASLLAYTQPFEILWDITDGGDYLNFLQKDQINTNPRVNNNWLRAYETINLVNNILANIDNVTDANVRNRIQGEALAIRGILYFEMVRLWAPQYAASTLNSEAIPIRTEPVNSLEDIGTVTRASVAQVYERLEMDLNDAAELLRPFGRNGTDLSEGACLAYLARVAMQKNDFSGAIDFSTQVINSGSYTLETDYRNVFNNPNNSSEDIFAIQQNASSNTGNRNTATGITTFYSGLINTGFGTLGMTRSFLTDAFGEIRNSPKFTNDDVRGLIDFEVDSSSVVNDVTTAFHANPNRPGLVTTSKYISTDHVLPVIRLAEMYLIRAEASFELNFPAINADAIADINRTRTRAGLTAYTASDFPIADALFESIVTEKNRELFYEGQLLHDLKRRRANLDSDEFMVGNDLNPLEDRFILPIPQSETDASGID